MILRLTVNLQRAFFMRGGGVFKILLGSYKSHSFLKECSIFRMYGETDASYTCKQKPVLCSNQDHLHTA